MNKKALRYFIWFSVICLLLPLLLVAGMYFFYANNSLSDGLLQMSIYDSVLGFKGKNNAIGIDRSPTGQVLAQIKLDSLGYRASSKLLTDSTPVLMAFGCSYTFGANCPADSTFAALTANRLNMRVVNAAIPSYGFAQMLLQAEKLIPLYKPKVVLFENTDWLIDRAQATRAGTWPGGVFVPYFSSAGNSLTVVKPLFRSSLFNAAPIADLKNKPYSIGSWVSFINYVYPALMKSQWIVFKAWMHVNLLKRDVPLQNKQQIAQHVFNQMQQICRANNCLLIIAGMEHQTFKPDSSVLYVDLQQALNARLEPGQNYEVAYKFTYQNPPVVFDYHPNPHAHRVMAEAIIAAIDSTARN